MLDIKVLVLVELFPQMLGTRGAFVADLRESSVTGGSYWGIVDVYGYYLTHGDVINLQTLQVLKPCSLGDSGSR